MNFATAVSTCFRKYADFSGRASRSEYWYFTLFCSLVSTGLGMILGEQALLVSLFSLATLVPTLAASWRRLHDIGKSGAWIFFGLVPIVGFIVVLVWLCKDSKPGENAYGPNPKEN